MIFTFALKHSQNVAHTIHLCRRVANYIEELWISPPSMLPGILFVFIQVTGLPSPFYIFGIIAHHNNTCTHTHCHRHAQKHILHVRTHLHAHTHTRIRTLLLVRSRSLILTPPPHTPYHACTHACVCSLSSSHEKKIPLFPIIFFSFHSKLFPLSLITKCRTKRSWHSLNATWLSSRPWQIAVHSSKMKAIIWVWMSLDTHVFLSSCNTDTHRER